MIALERVDGEVLRIGHRGAALIAPENTSARSGPPSTTVSTWSSSTSSTCRAARSSSRTPTTSTR